ncbi:MAG: alanyl-tRNA editing protein [Deltaproteobacteria bacterium]|nr:alanyl-tRNA editing protein [Deltaproteobacteria bacterium]
MAVEKVFWKDPYLTELTARVTGVEGDVVTLDRTVFFADSGGQESDSGSIGGFRVLDARKEDMEIRYTLAGPHDLKPGREVRIRIDWDRRYALMRHHFAAEIVLELVYQRFGPVNKIGAHISTDKARLDFSWEGNISREFPELLEAARRVIASDLPVTSAYSDEQRERRYWEVPGFARVSCGGTHIRSTGEVGDILLKRRNIGKGKERIEVTVGGASGAGGTGRA